MFKTLVQLSLILLAILNCSNSDEGNVDVRFDFVKASSWSNSVHNMFTTLIANFTSSYCQMNLTACTMEVDSDFSSENVQLVSGYPKFHDLYCTVIFYVLLPNSRTAVLPFNILTEIVTANQLEIWKQLQSLAGGTEIYAFRISHVNSVMVRPAYDETLNKIFIPFTLAVLIALAIFIAVCEISRSLHQKAELKAIQKRNLEKKSFSETRDSSDLFKANTDNQEISV